MEETSLRSSRGDRLRARRVRADRVGLPTFRRRLPTRNAIGAVPSHAGPYGRPGVEAVGTVPDDDPTGAVR
jgi:hypothetical protein